MISAASVAESSKIILESMQAIAASRIRLARFSRLD
jgi:hypothetical protein